MAVLDNVRNMKKQGMNDSQIVTALNDQGISPREINDAMAQANIKDAVSNPGGQEYNNEDNYFGGTNGMEPSMMNQQNQQPPTQPNLNPLPQEGPHSQEMGEQISHNGVPQPGQPYKESYDQEKYPPQYQNYSSYQQAGYDDYASQDAMSEIASQIVTEKTKTLSKKMSDLGEISTLLTTKVEKIDDRLSRIESIIDQLQTSLLRKATDQGQNISDIKTEMEAMQESFGKVINPLVTKSRKYAKRKTIKNKTKRKKKK